MVSPHSDLGYNSKPINPLRVLIAWDPRNEDSEPLHVAAWLARSTEIKVRVVTTFFHPWSTPSLKKLGKKYQHWFKEESVAVTHSVKESLTKVGIPKEAQAKKVSVLMAGASKAQILTKAAAKFGADILLLPANQSAPKNRIFAGTTADTLLHCSPVTLGLTPRGVKLSKQGITRVNIAFANDDEGSNRSALEAAAAMAQRIGVPLRIIAFSPSGLVHAPLSDPLNVAKELTAEWRERSLGLLDVARDSVAEKYPTLEVSSNVGLGTGWQGAVESLKWKKGDLMVLGSHPMGAFARVFIGSTVTELLPHLRVPVLVIPISR